MFNLLLQFATKLKIMLEENPNKWTGAGLKGSI
ncbi:Protein of unknown function [Lactobacillus helveticus CIRM-BIA 101]|nr:Protein of unknown function [Lactobacillus helveticus CIRM-BIA 101]